MADASRSALLRLLSWLSPAFPVGAFAYSHGLEQAIHNGLIRDRVALIDWLTDLLERGSGWNDAVLLAEAWRIASKGGDCSEITELAEALAGSRERHLETTLQGEAFADAVAAWDLSKSHQTLGRFDPHAYPVAVAAAAVRHGIPLHDTLTAYLHAFASNLIQASVRLVPLGQRDGVAALAALDPVILAVAEKAGASSLDDLGSCTVISDIMAMQHESKYSRVFRS
jgi:urease accessory protein